MNRNREDSKPHKRIRREWDIRAEQKRNLSRVTLFELSHDEVGLFVPYCVYDKHTGVIGREKIAICIERNCLYYQIFRPESRRYRR